MEGGGARPLTVARQLGSWALLASGVAAIAAMSWMVNHQHSVVFTTHLEIQFKDILGRVVNLTNLRRTGNIYSPFGYQAFTYPPGAILFFWPILWVPSQHLTLVWTALSLAALAGSFLVALAYLSGARRATLAGVSCWAAVLSAAVFPEVTECLVWGQTATILLLVVLLDTLAVRGPAKGVLVGVATAIKIYPGLFIIAWLLRREWRAAATAMLSAAVVTGTAAALWPTSARAFWRDVLVGGEEMKKLASAFNATKSDSVVAFFQRPPFHYGLLSPHEGLALSLAVMAIALASAHRLWRRGLDLSAVVVVLIGGAVASPVAWDHYFSFMPLLVLVAWEAGARSALGRTALVAAAVGLVPWTIFRTPVATTTWATTYSFVARNAVLLVALAVVVAGFVGGPVRERRVRRLAPVAPDVSTTAG